MSAVRESVQEPVAVPEADPGRDMDLGHLFRGYESGERVAPIGTPAYCGLRKMTTSGILPPSAPICVVCDAIWREERGMPPIPAVTHVPDSGAGGGAA